MTTVQLPTRMTCRTGGARRPGLPGLRLAADGVHRGPDPVRARQVPRLARRLAASTSPREIDDLVPGQRPPGDARRRRHRDRRRARRRRSTDASGGYLVAAWLGGIIVNLLLQADFYDIALRDFGLLLAALALARLATAFADQRRATTAPHLHEDER